MADNKVYNKRSEQDFNDIESLRLAICEINESLAYLSKMVLQIQKSINASRKPKDREQQPAPAKTTETVH